MTKDKSTRINALKEENQQLREDLKNKNYLKAVEIRNELEKKIHELEDKVKEKDKKIKELQDNIDKFEKERDKKLKSNKD